MSEAISDTQKMVLEFIHSFSKENNFPPSRQDICNKMGWASTTAAQYHVKRLEEEGFIKTKKGVNRGIKVLKLVRHKEL